MFEFLTLLISLTDEDHMPSSTYSWILWEMAFFFTNMKTLFGLKFYVIVIAFLTELFLSLAFKLKYRVKMSYHGQVGL